MLYESGQGDGRLALHGLALRERQLQGDGSAGVQCAGNGEMGANKLGPFVHVADTQSRFGMLTGIQRRKVEPGSVIIHRNAEGVWSISEEYQDGTGFRMFDNVIDRLLHNAIERDHRVHRKFFHAGLPIIVQTIG